MAAFFQGIFNERAISGTEWYFIGTIIVFQTIPFFFNH